MPTFLFEKCCCCIDLRIGCLIIGYFNLVGSALVASGMLMAVIGVSAVTLSDVDLEQNKAVGTAVLAVIIIFLIASLCIFALSILLLLGIHKNNRGYVKVFLIATVIVQIIMTIGTLIGIGSSSASGFISNLFNIFLSIYFLMVIRSYYYKMEGGT